MIIASSFQPEASHFSYISFLIHFHLLLHFFDITFHYAFMFAISLLHYLFLRFLHFPLQRSSAATAFSSLRLSLMFHFFRVVPPHTLSPFSRLSLCISWAISDFHFFFSLSSSFFIFDSFHISIACISILHILIAFIILHYIIYTLLIHIFDIDIFSSQTILRHFFWGFSAYTFSLLQFLHFFSLPLLYWLAYVIISFQRSWFSFLSFLSFS